MPGTARLTLAPAAAFDEPADTTEVLSRFAVVSGHDDDDDLLDTLRDGAGDKTAQAAGSEAGSERARIEAGSEGTA